VIAPNGNRSARRNAGLRATRPASDLGVTRVAGSVFIGLTGAGFIRLTPTEVRRLVDELVGHLDAIEGELS
jgi:hypothetical protein